MLGSVLAEIVHRARITHIFFKEKQIICAGLVEYFREASALLKIALMTPLALAENVINVRIGRKDNESGVTCQIFKA